MRRMMQTQGEGVGEQVQQGFTGLREELTAHREHVSDTQEQIWAHAQFLEENIDLLGVKLSEIKAQLAGPRPTPSLAAPQEQHAHSVQVHAGHPSLEPQMAPVAPTGGVSKSMGPHKPTHVPLSGPPKRYSAMGGG